MTRSRLTASALLFLVAAPGCGLFDRDREPYCPRLNALLTGRSRDNTADYPVMPGGDCAACAQGMPMNGQMMPGPIMTNPGQGGMVMPSNPATPMPMPGKIPPAGIKESEGKQFELEGASKIGLGPALGIPAGGSKMR